MRRTILFCVEYGLSLSDIRKMYIDEFIEYYHEIVWILEQRKELEQGSYDKVRGIDRSAEKIKAFANLWTNKQ